GLTQETTERLAGEAASAGVTMLSCRDPRDAEAGVLATLCGEDAPRGLARRAANILARAALDTPLPDTLRGSLPFPGQLTLNLETARTLRVALPEDLLREATLVAEEPLNPQREYTLVSAARTAAEGNLDLSAEQRKVRASSWNIPMAKANFLPQVDLPSTYGAVDEELANVANPERTWSASLKVTQLIYDEMARANVAIQKRLQAAAEQAYAGQELDIIELSAEAYVNVQLARALQRIQRTNLRQIRTYLELARRRYALGIGPEADVHRWEAALAQARIENINADKARLAANWQFNRVLNRDQGETFRVIEQPALAPELLTGPGELPDLMLDQALFEPLCAALADKALAEAPELRQLDELIAAQGKAFVALRRRYFIPTVGFQTEFRHKLDTSGKY
ncbi:MAG TPA: TolC family protein, partial [Candidatus Hydrogenedentes bacterium]|nr:TolC family protein [Candidatus Hydrogenedentota bacterium]